jgi:DNA-binding transcriptional LysR family regulator
MAEQIGIDRLTGLIAFARAGSLGSYTAAARSLSISPSAVSKSVQRLEQHLGVKLFSRTTRSLSLTAEGRDLHERAVKLLLDAEELQQAAAATRAEPAGTIKVTVSVPLGSNVLAPALPRFRELHPKLDVDLRLTDRIVDLIEEGIDVAIRAGNLADSRLIALPLGPHSISAFASPGYLTKRGTPLHPDEIGGHDCVNFRYQSSGQALRWPFRVGNNAIEIIPQAGIVVDFSDAVAKILAAGGGIGISPNYVAAPFVTRGELVPILTDFEVEHFNITALWPDSRRGNPNVKAFTAFLRELFPTPLPWDAVVSEAAARHKKNLASSYPAAEASGATE